jgi:hypothetical protein
MSFVPVWRQSSSSAIGKTVSFVSDAEKMREDFLAPVPQGLAAGGSSTMSRWAALAIALSFTACASSTHRQLHPVALRVIDVSDSASEVRGYQFTGLDALVQATIAEDFRSTIGQVILNDGDATDASEPVVTVTIAPGTFAHALSLNNPVRDLDQPEIVWFTLNYTVQTAGVVQKRGSIAAYGPEPRDFRGFQQDQLAVVKNVVAKLRFAVSGALLPT